VRQRTALARPHTTSAAGRPAQQPLVPPPRAPRPIPSSRHDDPYTT